MTLNSLCLIRNLLSQKKGEHYINVIKANRIMIPFPESLKFIFTVTKGFFLLSLLIRFESVTT